MPESFRHPRGSYHSHKRQLIGNQNAKQPPPAWKNTQAIKKPDQGGSKIFVSNLPPDVEAHDIIELFVKTVGPIKDGFLIYDRDGRKMGMAIVAFQRPGDATLARNKYDGVVIDSKGRISVEVITSQIKTTNQPAQAPKLIDRISTTAAAGSKQVQATSAKEAKPFVAPAARRRVKKGAKRVNKLAAIARKTLADLDKEIEEYKAAEGL